MRSLKEKWEQFRLWQHKPLQYKQMTKKKHLCHNCGQRFVGNFCPRCSQSANVKSKIGWETISNSFMDAVGFNARSLPRTICHLFFRPGYLIGDYISGHRQMSYPPLKMLVFVALALVIAENIPGWMGCEEAAETVAQDDNIDKIANWAVENPAWSTLSLCSLLILPTWLLFRHAPRHPRHTLPEGFFIQVFMATLILLIILLSYISDRLLWLIPIYYVVAYRQLFGYGLWGTTWRCLVGLLEMMLTVVVAVCAVKVKSSVCNEPGSSPLGKTLIVALVFILLAAAVAAIAHLIDRRTSPMSQEQAQRQQKPGRA